jgi:hypothetical protein
MQTEATQQLYPESFTHPRKDILFISLTQRTSLGSVTGEPTRIFFGNDLMSVVITAIGPAIFVDHDRDPLFHCFTK